MAQINDEAPPTHYQILHVHPGAPLDLITAAYWRLTGLLQSSRGDTGTDVALYHLTRAYQALADHMSREAYDRSLGLNVQSLPRIPQTRRSSWNPFSSRLQDEVEPDIKIDYYELMRIDPAAHPAVVGEAWVVMRNYYLRLVEQGQARPEFVLLLEEANAVLSDPLMRQEYDARRSKKQPAERPNGGKDTEPAENLASVAVLHANAERGPSDEEQADVWSAANTPVDGTSKVKREQAAVSAEAVARAGGTGTDRQPAKPNGRSPKRRRGSASPVAEASAQAAQIDLPSGPPVTSRALKVLAAASAKVVRGGKGSAHLARTASKGLRSVIEGSSGTANGVLPQEDEEEALISRLFVTVADKSKHDNSVGPRVLARLTISTGDEGVASYDVSRVPVTLGDDATCDIKLAGLAPRQARLLYHGGQFVLHALADGPAVSLHGHPVSWALLRDGESVEVGPYSLRVSPTQ